MQCPRCFFENPADAKWCGYCGHAFADAPAAPKANEGRAARKHATRLGVVPDDPFAPVAASLRGGAAAPVPPPRPPTPPRPSRAAAPAPEVKPAAPAQPVPPAEPVRPRRRAHQATVVDGDFEEEPDRAEIIGMILVLPDGGEARSFILRAGQRRIGRESDNDVRIDDPRASGHHAILRAEPGRVWLLDTSTNGTVVNGSRIRADRAPVADGSVIEVGRTLLAVQIFAEDTLGVLRGSRP